MYFTYNKLSKKINDQSNFKLMTFKFSTKIRSLKKSRLFQDLSKMGNVFYWREFDDDKRVELPVKVW